MLTAAAVFAVVGTAFAIGIRINDNVCKAPVGPNGCPVTCASGAPEDEMELIPSSVGQNCYVKVASTVTQCNTQSCITRGFVLPE